MHLFLIQFCILFVLLIGSTLGAWYEGSAILHEPWEWEYSTPFSQIFNGEVHSSDQISQVDHFVYAAKFQPTFPIFMVLSSIYLIILIGYHFFRYRPKKFAYYLSFWGIIFLILSVLINNSPTIGGQILFYAGLLCGLLCLGTSAIICIRLVHLNNEVRIR